MFINQQRKSECVYKNLHVIVANFIIKDFTQVLPFLELSKRREKPILLIVRDIEETVLQQLLMNKKKAELEIVVVDLPGAAEYKDKMAEDFRLMFSCKVV